MEPAERSSGVAPAPTPIAGRRIVGQNSPMTPMTPPHPTSCPHRPRCWQRPHALVADAEDGDADTAPYGLGTYATWSMPTAARGIPVESLTIWNCAMKGYTNPPAGAEPGLEPTIYYDPANLTFPIRMGRRCTTRFRRARVRDRAYGDAVVASFAGGEGAGGVGHGGGAATDCERRGGSAGSLGGDVHGCSDSAGSAVGGVSGEASRGVRLLSVSGEMVIGRGHPTTARQGARLQAGLRQAQ